jgi:hypothetical protein
MKTSFIWIAVAAVVACLCGWKWLSHPLSRVDAGFSDSSLVNASTTELPTRTAPAINSRRSIASSRVPATDDGLRRLERDIARAATIADPDERANELVAACLRWAEVDPPDALRIAQTLRVDQVSNAICEDIIQKWAAKDFPAALTWAGNEPGGEQRDHLMARLAYVQASTQPSAAAQLVVEQISTGAIQTEAGFAVLHQWALRDFDAAAAWANAFPAELQERGHAELVAIARFRLAQHEAR